MPREWLIQHRAGTLAEWAAAETAGPVLLAGERAYITDTKTDVVGDGVTKVASLGAVGSGTYVQITEYPPCPQQFWQSGDTDWTAAFGRLFAAGRKTAFVPGNSGTPYDISSGLTMPVSMTSLTLDPEATIRATSTMASAMLTIGDLVTQKRYGIVSGGTWECNNMARDGIFVPWHWGQTIADCNINNHTRHGLILGSTSAPKASNEHKIRGVNTYRDASGATPVGSYGLWLPYSHDGDCSDVTVTSAETSFRMDSLGSRFISCHGWSHGLDPQKVTFADYGGNNEWIGCESDNPSQYGWDLNQWNSRIIGGFSLVNNPSLTTSIGFHVSVSGGQWEGSIIGHNFAADNGAAWARDYDGIVPFTNLVVGGITGYGVTTKSILGKTFVDAISSYGGVTVNGVNSGPTILGGAGNPNTYVNANAGDMWIRKDAPGTAGARIYMCTGGTAWVASGA